jgi:tetratricopeptide (TPR) repeat protein
LADALYESGDDEAWTVLSEAGESLDPRTRAQALVSMATLRLGAGHATSLEDRQAWRSEARAVFEEHGDDYGLGRYWISLANEAWFGQRAREAADAYEHALAHLERVGAAGARLRRGARARLGGCYYHGPTPVDEALERVQALRAGEHGLLADAWARINVARLHAMKGEFESADELWTEARQLHVDAGLHLTAGSFALGGGEIAFRAGEVQLEEARYREGLASLERLGERAFYSTVALALAECLYRTGASEWEIEELCAAAREATSPDDLANFIWLDIVQGALQSRRGNFGEAEERSRRAVARAETTDFHLARTQSRVFLAEVLARAGRTDEAARVAAESFRIFEDKGDVAGLARFRSYLASVGVAVA